MPKFSTLPRAARKVPQPKVHRYIDALVADDYGGMRALTAATAGSFAKKKLDAASQGLQVRSEQREKAARRIEAREAASAERGLQSELRESDRRIQLFWRRMKTKLRPEKDRIVRHKPPGGRARPWPHASVALPRHDGPVVDRNGARGVFVRIRYESRRTSKPGVSQHLTLYCYHGAALDADGVPYVRSNIGETIDEALCGLDHLEQVNWSAQKNAKILTHGIFAVDHRQTPDQMMQVGTRWAEEALGRFDLPYIIALHAPPEDGDGRNWHLHILWSSRPMIRTGDHDWQVAEMLRTDLDNPAAMKLFRELYAAVMTDVSFEAGQNQLWTAKSNAARGLVHEPQVHLGAAQTNRARQGEHVPANEDNHERVMRSKAAVLDEELRHADEALAREQELQRAIAGRWARRPAMPVRVPQRVMAAVMSAALPDVTEPVARVSTDVARALPLPARSAAAKPGEPVAELTRVAVARSARAGRPSVSGNFAVLPPSPARVAPMEIANLRFALVAQSDRAVLPTLVAPRRPSAPAKVMGLPALMTTAVKRVGVAELTGLSRPPVRQRTVAPVVLPLVGTPVDRVGATIPVLARPTRFVTAATVGELDPVTLPLTGIRDTSFANTVARVREALRRDDDRRARELAEADRARAAAAQHAAAAGHRRLALERLFAAIADERHYLAREKGMPVIDPLLLDRFGLTPINVAGDEARKRIAQLAERQAAEVLAIANHVRRSPRDLMRDGEGNGEGWALVESAPADVRALVAAWRNSAVMQTALGRAAASSASQPTNDVAPLEPGAAWREARTSRERAMADGDAIERLDDNGLAQPGRRIARPGLERIENTLPIARRFPGVPGSGIGG